MKCRYKQIYRSEWEDIGDFKRWLCKEENGVNAFCKACDTSFLSRLASIKKHAEGLKHIKNLERYNGSNQSSNFKNDNTFQDSRTAASDVEDFEVMQKYNASSEDGFEFVQTNDKQVISEIECDKRGEAPSQYKLKQKVDRVRIPNKCYSKKHIAARKERFKLLTEKQSDKNELLDPLQDLLHNMLQTSLAKEKKPIDLFFESIVSSVKALSPKRIVEAKMRFSQIVCELELRDLTDSNLNSASGVSSGNFVLLSPATGANTFTINAQVLNAPEDKSGGQNYNDSLS